MKTALIIGGIWFIVALIVLGIWYLIIIPETDYSEYVDDFDNADEDVLL